MFGRKSRRLETYETMLAALAKDRAEALRTPASNITINQEIEYRPCYVRGRRALFHRWTNSARPQLPKGVEPAENVRYFQYRNTHAIVEFEDGTVDLAFPRDVRFADPGNFSAYVWMDRPGTAERQEDTYGE